MEEFTGRLVLVHPELKDDPALQQGKIGIVTSMDIAKDEVFVSFGGPRLALYSTDALMLMRPSLEIYGDTLSNRAHIGTEDFKSLLRVSMLLDSHDPQQFREAMEMAAVRPAVLHFATISMLEQISILPRQSEDVGQKAGRSR